MKASKIRFYGKCTLCVLMSLLFCVSVLAPAGYAADAGYDRSSESLRAVLELYGKDARDVKSARYVIDASEMAEVSACSAAPAAASADTSTVRLTFDDNLVIDLVDDVVDGISNFEPITDEAQKVFGLSDMTSVIKSVTEIANLGAGYSITYSEEFDEDYWRLTWEKSYGEIVNSYESVNAVVNRRTGELVVYERFDEAPNTLPRR